MSLIFHIATQKDWKNAQAVGFYSHDSLEKEGFIHCSTKEQVSATLDRFFKNTKNLVLLEIDPQKLDTKIIFENAGSDQKPFPHIYGTIPLAAVNNISILS